MAMTTEQILLLNNLMYIEANSDRSTPFRMPDNFEGETVGDWVNSIDTSRLTDADCGSLTTGTEWRKILQAVKQDETLMNMTIAETHVDTAGGGGRSAVFLSEGTGDAVLVFKGTESSQEWADNFTGGNVTDTPYQQNALEWYQQAREAHGLDNYDITVTGHSKGGNKAKYITLLDDSVDHCVSFDGQGFSDEFVEKYRGEIAARQDHIQNHNVDYDYVNILLNDVGETTYYEGYDYGKGGFLENHCANTFMKFEEDGSFSMTPAPNGQAEEMRALDAYLNNLIRSMPEEQQTNTLRLVNVIVDEAFSLDENSVSTFLQLAADPNYSDELAYGLAYTIRYEQAHPEFGGQIKSVLSEFGMEDINKYIDVITGVLNYEVTLGPVTLFDFDSIVDNLSIAAFALSSLPDWLVSKIRDNLLEKGINLTNEQLRNLLRIVFMVRSDMEEIKIKNQGGDIRVPSDATGKGRHGDVRVYLPGMREGASELAEMGRELEEFASCVQQGADKIEFSIKTRSAVRLKRRLQDVVRDLETSAGKARRLSESLTGIADLYVRTENKNLGAG